MNVVVCVGVRNFFFIFGSLSLFLVSLSRNISYFAFRFVSLLPKFDNFWYASDKSLTKAGEFEAYFEVNDFTLSSFTNSSNIIGSIFPFFTILFDSKNRF